MRNLPVVFLALSVLAMVYSAIWTVCAGHYYDPASFYRRGVPALLLAALISYAGHAREREVAQVAFPAMPDAAIETEMVLEQAKHSIPPADARAMRHVAAIDAASGDPATLGAEMHGRADPLAVLCQVHFARRLRPRAVPQPVRGAAFHQDMAHALAKWRRDGQPASLATVIEDRFLNYFSYDERLLWRLRELGLGGHRISQLMDLDGNTISCHLRAVREALVEIAQQETRLEKGGSRA
jgi:hypothetical protein